MPKVYEAGKAAGGDTEAAYERGLAEGQEAEWNRFWDLYQINGNRSRYIYAFAGTGWGQNGLLPPKYPITLEAGTTTQHSMFACFNCWGTDRYDLTEVCKMLDCSKATVLRQMCANACAENITLDLSSCTNATEMFSCALGGGNIDKVYLKVTEKLTTTSNMFQSCANLVTLIFTEDSVINAALAFSSSSLLSSESVDSIINALKDRTGTSTLKLTVHKDVYNRMVASGQDVLVTAKNWTLVSG